MSVSNPSRATHEIEHGRKLAQNEPERIWGWDTPAGRLRAVRRGDLIALGAALGPGKRALEIGCGTGLFTEMFAQSGAQIVAVDISPELLEKARARGLQESQVRFLAMPFEECDVEGPFDAVIGSSVLHHLDIKPALAKIFTLLKPGGVLFFAEPNMLNPMIIVLKNIKWIKRRFGDSPNETAFFRWRFRRLLIEAGFESPVITPYDWLHPATPEKMIGAVKAAGEILEKTPLLKEFAGSLLIRANRPTS
jgi:2-polyprenyl-3-methyl-5-hydroxy-6-metoxy-1,4-benzoquinol methylase